MFCVQAILGAVTVCALCVQAMLGAVTVCALCPGYAGCCNCVLCVQAMLGAVTVCSLSRLCSVMQGAEGTDHHQEGWGLSDTGGQPAGHGKSQPLSL